MPNISSSYIWMECSTLPWFINFTSGLKWLSVWPAPPALGPVFTKALPLRDSILWVHIDIISHRRYITGIIYYLLGLFLYLKKEKFGNWSRFSLTDSTAVAVQFKHRASHRSDFHLYNFLHKACGTCHFLRSGKYTLSLTPPPKLMIVKLVSEQSGAPLLRPTVSICMKLLALIHAMNRG